jgi:hypothetical protein
VAGRKKAVAQDFAGVANKCCVRAAWGNADITVDAYISAQER